MSLSCFGNIHSLNPGLSQALTPVSVRQPECFGYSPLVKSSTIIPHVVMGINFE